MRSDRDRPALLGCLLSVLACGGADPAEAGDADSTADDSAGDSSGAESTTGVTPPGAPTSGSSASSDSSDTGVETSSAEATGDGSATGVDCGDATFGPGFHADIEIEHDGRARTFDLFVPSARDGDGAIPLVINMHGWGSSKEQQASFSGMSEDAEERGYAVAYPQGFESSWNGGACCGGAKAEDVDDVGFVVAIIEHLEDQACIDRDRVYATGFSNGGYMAYRIACEVPGMFAAVAPVAAVLGIAPEDCNPDEPMSVIHFHGTADFNVAYDGRPWLGAPGVREVMEDWAARNGCDPDPVVTSQVDDVTCETWPSCDGDAEVTLCTIDGAGHCWPGNPDCTYGDSTTTISANQRMFDAFDLQSR